MVEQTAVSLVVRKAAKKAALMVSKKAVLKADQKVVHLAARKAVTLAVLTDLQMVDSMAVTLVAKRVGLSAD